MKLAIVPVVGGVSVRPKNMVVGQLYNLTVGGVGLEAMKRDNGDVDFYERPATEEGE